MTESESDLPAEEGPVVEPEAGEKRRRHLTLGIVFLTVAIDLLGFGIVLPLLPRYASFYNLEVWELSTLMAVFSAMQFLFAPI